MYSQEEGSSKGRVRVITRGSTKAGFEVGADSQKSLRDAWPPLRSPPWTHQTYTQLAVCEKIVGVDKV